MPCPHCLPDQRMADKSKKRRLHVGVGAEADALVDSFHELRGSMSVQAFLKSTDMPSDPHLEGQTRILVSQPAFSC